MLAHKANMLLVRVMSSYTPHATAVSEELCVLVQIFKLLPRVLLQPISNNLTNSQSYSLLHLLCCKIFNRVHTSYKYKLDLKCTLFVIIQIESEH